VPGGFVASVPPPSKVSSEPLVIAQSLALAGLIVLLMPFPAQLFNSTLETHYATVRRWFRLDALQRATGRVSGFWDSVAGILAFVLLSALIYALLDPSLGLDARGAATIVGLAIGIVLTAVMASAPSLISALRNHGKWRMRALPATLIVGLACVLISRLTGFLPGYLYGVILGFVFARELSRAEQGRANGLAAAALLAMSLVSWLLLALIGPAPSGIVATIAATALSTLLVASLEAVVFGLLPFRFLPGEPLHTTNRLFWAALLLVGAFCFFHILINPASGYLGSSARTPFFTVVALFLAFGLLSVAFWAYFRNKPTDTAHLP
jgi:MFS family permease